MNTWWIVEDAEGHMTVYHTPPEGIEPQFVFHVIEKRLFDEVKATADKAVAKIAKMTSKMETQSVDIGSLDFKHQTELKARVDFETKYKQLVYAAAWLVEVIGGCGLPRWRESMMKEYHRRLSSPPPELKVVK